MRISRVFATRFHANSPPEFTGIGRRFHGFWPLVSSSPSAFASNSDSTTMIRMLFAVGRSLRWLSTNGAASRRQFSVGASPWNGTA